MTSNDLPPSPKFIADCHLGRVAKYLRILGYDTLFFSHIEDNDLIKLSNAQDRIILTRDRELSERKSANAFLLKPTEIKEQLITLFEEFGLSRDAYDFSRCTVDNTPLEVVEKEKVIDKLPGGVKKHFDFFEQCPACGRIYWHGDHYRNMMSLLDDIV
jgi:uncharacterized protein with PIN domain